VGAEKSGVGGKRDQVRGYNPAQPRVATLP